MQCIPSLTPGTPVASVSTEAGLARLGAAGGASSRCQVVAGTTDSVAAFVAARCTQPGDAVTSLGSSLALKLVSATRVDDSAKGVYSHRLCGNWLVGGASNLGGWVLRSNFSNDEVERLTEELDLEAEREQEEREEGKESVGSPSSREERIPDYYPGALLGFGLSVEEATAALTPRPARDVDFLRAILGSIANVVGLRFRSLCGGGGGTGEGEARRRGS